MICAKIENDIVVNVIVCDNPQWATQNLGGEWILAESAGIGYKYENGELIRPKNWTEMTTKDELKAWIIEHNLQEHFDLRKSFENLVIDVKNYYSEE